MRQLVLACLLVGSVAAQYRVPAAKDPYVNDYARVLSDATEARVRAKLAPLRDRDVQITVLTVERLRDWGARADQAASFAQAVYDGWGVGVAGVDHGALLFVAVRDHKWDLRLGRGYLSRATPDVMRAVGDALSGPFRREDYGTGVLAALDVVVSRIVETAAPPTPRRDAEEPPPTNSVDRLIEEERRAQGAGGFDVEHDATFEAPDVDTAPPVAPPQDAGRPEPPYRHREDRTPQTLPHAPGFSLGCGSWICWVLGAMFLLSAFRRRRPPTWGGGYPYARGGGVSWGSVLGGMLIGSLLRGGSRGGSSGSSSGSFFGGRRSGGGGGMFGGGSSGGGFGGSW